MATIKTTYVIQSCPRCGKKLLKAPLGSCNIGSPLIECRQCGHTCRTDLRAEWYAYPAKWQVWAMPLITGGVMLLVGLFMGEPAIAVMAGMIGLLIGLCISLVNIVRMLLSLRRMKDSAYLDKLLAMNAISQSDYNRFIIKAGK